MVSLHGLEGLGFSGLEFGNICRRMVQCTRRRASLLRFHRPLNPKPLNPKPGITGIGIGGLRSGEPGFGFQELRFNKFVLLHLALRARGR